MSNDNIGTGRKRSRDEKAWKKNVAKKARNEVSVTSKPKQFVQ